MNWVGGSRNRLVLKNDAKKQREFFAKRKLEQKLRNLEVAPSVSSTGDTWSGSTDLLNLFVVNQIASKKTTTEPPKVAVFGSSKGSKHHRNHPIVLPMSPCSPSHLNLVGSPAQFGIQDATIERPPQRIKYGQLSPVLESAFSDNSASDYLPGVHDPPISISPSLSSTSGQGLFTVQMKSQTQSQPLHHYPPPTWDSSAWQRPEFQPFFQPRCMTDPISWSVRSSPPPFQLETPTASQVQFRSPNTTEARNAGEHSGPFCLDQVEVNQSTLEFPLSQSEPLNVFEEEVVRRFSENKHGTGSARFGNGCSDVYLRDESSGRPSSPQTVPNLPTVGMELTNCTDRNSSCLGQNPGFLKSFEHSPSCSCRAGYFSSDSSDEEPCCESCHQDSAFYLDDACSDHLKSASQKITVISQLRPLTPLMSSKMNGGDDQNMIVNEASSDKASGSQQTGSSVALSSSPRPPGETHTSEVCGCKKTFAGAHDAGTQTLYSDTADTCDASTQCSFSADTLHRPALDASQQFSANESETDAQPQMLRDPSKKSASKTGAAPWSGKESKTEPRSRTFNSVPLDNILQEHINPLFGVWSPRGEKNGDKGEQTWPDENNPPMKEESDGGGEEVKSEGRSSTYGPRRRRRFRK